MTTKRALLPVAMSVALIFAASATALAAGAVLDQQVATYDNGFSVNSVYSPAQIFTAGITGNLAGIDLYLTTGPGPGTPAADLTVELWTVTGGAPDHAIDGASQKVLATDVPTGGATWRQLPFKAHSVAGTQYAIVLSSPGSPAADCPDVCWAWISDETNPYAGGLSYYSPSGGAWVAQARDLDFKTYVLPLFSLQVYLTGVGEGAFGSVTSGDPGIDCGATCLASYPEARAVTLTAHPAVTATFGYWQGGPCDQSHNPVCSFAMPAQSVATTATFYGKPTPTIVPTPHPSPSHAPPTPTAAASIEATGEPSSAPSESASLSPGSSPSPSVSPTTIPTEPASDGDGSIVPIALGLVLLIVLLGGALYMSRRRLAGAPPPDAGSPPHEA